MSADSEALALARPRGRLRAVPAMGYQPALDGLRAVSVLVVLLYHAGFSWMSGGFFGVEVFFVVSGFLITSLLIEERARSGAIGLADFWRRRARRLLPAFFAVVLAVAVWTALWGTPQQVAQVKRDVPWSVVYLANWGQITGDTPYFAEEPALLRHLWSLAVEEQWYLVWPLVVVVLLGARWSMERRAAAVAGVAVAVVATMFLLAAGGETPLTTLFVGEVDRVNFLYLSTWTRAGGLLFGAAAAFVWRPWLSSSARRSGAGRVLDPLAAGALALLGCISTTAVLTEQYVYRWLLPVVSVLSLVTVLAAVHPAAVGFRRAMSWQPLVEVGRRSYGLYLWSWPIFVVVGATGGSVRHFSLAMVITTLVAEVSYRFLETPIRRGAFGRWWQNRPAHTLAPLAAGAFLVIAVTTFYVRSEVYDPFTDPNEARPADVDPGATPAAVGEVGLVGDEPPPETSPDTTAGPPRPSLAIVGDSQAHALAVNLPDSVDTSFASVTNGSVDGCSVWDSGRVASSVPFSNSFAGCRGWQEKWAVAAEGNDVTLVVIGAWDVFDREDGDDYYPFASSRSDTLFAANLQSGIDAILSTGSRVGLLEVACMRPVAADGAAIPQLPERADDARVAHVNELVRWVASQYGPEVEFVEGPREWCSDEQISTDPAYRWDGVHVYRPGAELISDVVADDLLALTAV